MEGKTSKETNLPPQSENAAPTLSAKQIYPYICMTYSLYWSSVTLGTYVRDRLNRPMPFD